MVSRRELLLSIPALAVLASADRAQAADKWVLLGEREVTDKLDHDTLNVTGTHGEFKALQVRVRGNAVEFRDMKVHFAKGRTQDVELRRVIPAGGESRAIDLVGKDRIVERVEFWYDAQTRRGHAKVRLFGRR